MPSPSSQTILVTGANGFIAGHIVKQALEAGYKVRGTARSEASGSKLREIYADRPSQFSLAVVPDISKPESYANAFEGNVTAVIHTASPFVLHTDDNKRDLLDPAVHGAVAVLEATQRYGHNAVHRVVSTSSFASIIDLSKGMRQGYTYTEAD